ncbi:hypothetical protein PV325_011670 [Microctonus aethiopoides]|uniref:Uncharacterized protein n=1 Tax=Microctonus aethiopoides TaxID=144406 RepID=A0AA39F022_9HYME|nr:hypothetical protein PV325_011670 [Microctonus aethiopoides]KAK0157438.1 hypothetical protein PV328_011182 [Microctonus aethiopoides]
MEFIDDHGEGHPDWKRHCGDFVLTSEFDVVIGEGAKKDFIGLGVSYEIQRALRSMAIGHKFRFGYTFAWSSSEHISLTRACGCSRCEDILCESSSSECWTRTQDDVKYRAW